MKGAIPITALFPGIGGILLTDEWDHHARQACGDELQVRSRLHMCETGFVLTAKMTKESSMHGRGNHATGFGAQSP